MTTAPDIATLSDQEIVAWALDGAEAAYRELLYVFGTDYPTPDASGRRPERDGPGPAR